MKTVKLNTLVLDFDLYPRGEVDRQHCYYIRQALEAGAELPPLVVCKKTKRIADGFHRFKVYEQVYGLEHEIEVVEKTYKSEAALFLDAIRYNAAHGRTLTTYDRVHCISHARRLNINTGDLAPALGLTKEKVEHLEKTRLSGVAPQTRQGVTSRTVGKAEASREPLKRTIGHMSGRTLTADQSVANDKLGGMNQQFYVNQIIILIENELLDTENATLMARVERLRELLAEICVSA